jgi:hypothetical protein
MGLPVSRKREKIQELGLHLLADSLTTFELLEFDVDDSSLLCLNLKILFQGSSNFAGCC